MIEFNYLQNEWCSWTYEYHTPFNRNCFWSIHVFDLDEDCTFNGIALTEEGMRMMLDSNIERLRP